MKAATRSQYLQAMGVTQWLPRHALNAGESQEFYQALAQPAAVSQQEVSVSLAGDQRSNPTAAMSASHLLDNLRAGERSPAAMPDAETIPQSLAKSPTRPDAITVIAEATHVESETANDSASVGPASSAAISDNQTPRFALYIVPLCPHISWVFDAQIDQSLLLAFCHRVKQGMGLDVGFQPNMTEFRWPFIESSQQDQSTPVAIQALKAQWQFMREQGCQQVFTWGSDSSHWFAQAGATVAFANPSPELNLSADIKRKIWKALTSIL